jgi:hypothetical protein
MPLWVHAECEIRLLDIEDDLDGCDAVVRVLVDDATETTAGARDAVVLTGVVHNLTDQPLELAVTDLCPEGRVQFAGLGDDVDVYGTCLAADCDGYGETVVLTLMPGEPLIDEVLIELEGDDCSAPLSDGSYVISGALALVDAAESSVCEQTAELRVER